MIYDAVIVGGGAAGLAGAAFLGRAARRCGGEKHLLLLEKAPRVGKKLLATGNGTCNLTNMHAAPAHYHGDAALATAVLAAFPPERTVAFFESVGVDCAVRETGRVYPLSEQAAAVLDALRLEAAACGVEIACDRPAERLSSCREGWRVDTPSGAVLARRVLFCPGGAASPSLGGSADGYRLLTDLGCEKTPLFPSIVQVRTATEFVRAVKGIRVDATVRMLADGNCVGEETGEVLFTDYGLSGPAVMQVSRPVADWERRKKGAMTAVLDLLPAWSEERLRARLEERRQLPRRTLEDLFTGLLHKRVGQTVLRVAGILPLDRPVSTLTDEDCARAAATVKAWKLEVTGTQGFGGAQVTAGGIAAGTVDPQTMECRRHPGLYLAGEVLDVDGDCGGFNLQFAWSSAYVAATAMMTE